MVAAHEQNLGRLPTAALSDAQHMKRTAFDASPDLAQLSNVRPEVRQLPRLLLEAGGGMIAADGLGGREGPQVGLQVLHLLHGVAHTSETVDLRLGRAQNQVIRLHLPDIETQRYPQKVRQWHPQPGRGNPDNQLHVVDSLAWTAGDRELLARSRMALGESAGFYLVLGRGAETLDTCQPTPFQFAQHHRRHGRDQRILLALPDIE
jgi:hypothetical protein